MCVIYLDALLILPCPSPDFKPWCWTRVEFDCCCFQFCAIQSKCLQISGASSVGRSLLPYGRRRLRRKMTLRRRGAVWSSNSSMLSLYADSPRKPEGYRWHRWRRTSCGVSKHAQSVTCAGVLKLGRAKRSTPKKAAPVKSMCVNSCLYHLY